MISTTLSGIPAYSMNCINLPRSVSKHIESVARNFFWGDENGKTKLATIAWDRICGTKELGG